MTTAIATVVTTRVCKVCFGPSTETEGLVYEIGGYIHPGCSGLEYDLVTEVSFPDDDPDPTTPAPAAHGPVLCEDCEGCHDPFELCENCQEAWNEWDSDHAPDYDVLYERHLSDRFYGIIAA